MAYNFCIIGVTLEDAQNMRNRCEWIGPQHSVRLVSMRSYTTDGLSPDVIIYRDDAVLGMLHQIASGQQVAKNPIGILKLTDGRAQGRLS